jgi:hypothetical protein
MDINASANTLQPCTPIPTNGLLICIAILNGGNQLLEPTSHKITISIYGTLQSHDFNLYQASEDSLD